MGNAVESLAVPTLLLGRRDVGLGLLRPLDELSARIGGLLDISFIGEIDHEQSLTWLKTLVNSDPILCLEDSACPVKTCTL